MNYYELLDVPVNATTDEIKKHYRKYARIYHPDKGGDPEKFKEIQTAYETLMNPIKRHQYDIDLSGNNNLGKIYNCEIVKSENKLRDTQYIPYRRISKIKHLKHESNGFENGNWKDKMTRWNQLKYHNEVSKGFHDITKDGINSLDFKLKKRNMTGKYIHLNVEL